MEKNIFQTEETIRCATKGLEIYESYRGGKTKTGRELRAYVEEHLSAGWDSGGAVPHPAPGSAPACPQELPGCLGCSEQPL